MSTRVPPSGSTHAAVAQSLRIDATTVEVIRRFEADDIGVRLLKGPVCAAWLYEHAWQRTYRDTDLLIAPQDEARAEAALESLGFRADRGTGRPDPGVALNHSWRRGNEIVELHVRITGMRATPQAVWNALGAHPQEQLVAGRSVSTLPLAGRLLHTALHAAQHGGETSQPLEDLERACRLHGLREWQAAVALGAQVDALDAAAEGLALVPVGEEIRRSLGLSRSRDAETRLRAGSAPPPALGMARLLGQEPGWARLRHLLRVIAPSPAFIRWWTPIARRGRAGLVLGYLWRYCYLVSQVPATIRAFRRLGRD